MSRSAAPLLVRVTAPARWNYANALGSRSHEPPAPFVRPSLPRPLDARKGTSRLTSALSRRIRSRLAPSAPHRSP
jgi:hypothetical protein